MARTALAEQNIVDTGLIPAYTAANVAGHSCSPGTFLHVKNGSGASINVTVQTGKEVEARAVADDVIAIAAGAEKMIALTDTDLLARPAAPDRGKVYVDFSAVTTVTCALFALV